MAGKLHCVKNKGRTDKFCSPTVSVGSHSFDVLFRVSALLKIDGNSLESIQNERKQKAF